MNIFQKKNKSGSDIPLPLSPIELYQTCQFKEGFGYLRGIQEEVLNIWHKKRSQRDVVCKMSTGSGKTLTGLLMLYSKLVEGVGPCLYVVPDNQLLEQTELLASNYGIPVCTFQNNSFPADFINKKAVLLCNFHKLFNGKTIFNRDQIALGAVVLDDAHKCVDIAREQTTIKLDRGWDSAKRLFSLFTNVLKQQLEGTFVQLEHSDPHMMMKVPYWAWLDHQEEIQRILHEHVSKINADQLNNETVKFNWNIITNNLRAYDCYIGSDFMEIAPIHVPYHEVTSFDEAKHRYVLSATFEDSYDLIKDLGISIESINDPIIPVGRKDVGKRLIIAPRRFDPLIEDSDIRKMVSDYAKEYNVIVLVPSTSKGKEEWLPFGATIVGKDNIDSCLRKLGSSQGNLMVFANRYDGIDLYNDLCRILVMDGMPKFTSLVDKYYEGRLESLRASKRAQIIEQGLGRSTRSGSDFSVTYLMGADLLEFIGYTDNLEYFTPITRAQLRSGLELLEGEKTDNSINTIKETSNYCLKQDKEFLDYINKIILETSTSISGDRDDGKLRNAEIERQALLKFMKRRYTEASDIILTNLVTTNNSTKTRAWYSQFAAQLVYLDNKPQSNNLQIKANDLSSSMFYPANGSIKYRAIKNKGKQAEEISRAIRGFSIPQDIIIYINRILTGLVYHPDLNSKTFEHSLAEIGKILGFSAQRPELETGNGPDVLWCLPNDLYLILEAKSEAVHPLISRDDINQLLGSETWFRNNYPNKDYLLVTLQKPRKKGEDVNIHSQMRVLDEERLQLLHRNILHFAGGLQSLSIEAHLTSEIEHLIMSHALSADLFVDTYLKNIK